MSDGTFARTVTGKLHTPITGSGLAFRGTITEFRMDEHGQMIQGVMNRYSMAKSPAAGQMLSQYGAIYFGGNFVALDAIK